MFESVTVNINNETFCNGIGQSITFSDDHNNPQYAGIIISKVFPYLDGKDEINLGTDNEKIFYGENALDKFEWKIDEDSLTSSSVALTGTSTNATYAKSNLAFNVRLHLTCFFN